MSKPLCILECLRLYWGAGEGGTFKPSSSVLEGVPPTEQFNSFSSGTFRTGPCSKPPIRPMSLLVTADGITDSYALLSSPHHSLCSPLHNSPSRFVRGNPPSQNHLAWLSPTQSMQQGDHGDAELCLFWVLISPKQLLPRDRTLLKMTPG